jgi:hypothetical protein
MKKFRSLPAILALFAGAVAVAQDSAAPARRGPHGPPPEVNSDGTIALPDGTVLTPPTVNSDGSITLPDGTVLPAPPMRVPPVKNSDGTLTLLDGPVVAPNADGTYTLPDGHTIDLTQGAPAGRPGPRRPRPGNGG